MVIHEGGFKKTAIGSQVHQVDKSNLLNAIGQNNRKRYGYHKLNLSSKRYQTGMPSITNVVQLGPGNVCNQTEKF